MRVWKPFCPQLQRRTSIAGESGNLSFVAGSYR
jgi:hypothetical protein